MRGFKKRYQWCHGQMKGYGYRMTVGREAVLDVLSKEDAHLSAEEIYMRVHAVYPSIGLTSVYRTLDILVNHGLVYKFDFGDGRARFELAEKMKGENHHHHLVCTGCGRVINYTDLVDEELALIKKTEEALSRKYKYEIKDHLIQFYGLCPNCIR